MILPLTVPPLLAALLAFAAAPSLAQSRASAERDLFSDTWVATDALGRKMPTHAEVGPVKKDQRRVVGIFYITWHTDSLANLKSPTGCQAPSLDRGLVPLGRAGDGLLPQQG